MDQKKKIIISQDILLESYAKPYRINRERIAYKLSSLINGTNILIQILFFNSNGTLIQLDRLEKSHEINGLCKQNTHLIRVEIHIKPSKEKIFIEYIHLNLTSQYNIHRPI